METDDQDGLVINSKDSSFDFFIYFQKRKFWYFILLRGTFSLIVFWVFWVLGLFTNNGKYCENPFLKTGGFLTFAFTLYFVTLFSGLFSEKKLSFPVFAALLAFINIIGILLFFLNYNDEPNQFNTFLINIMQICLAIGTLIYAAMTEAEKE